MKRLFYSGQLLQLPSSPRFFALSANSSADPELRSPISTEESEPDHIAPLLHTLHWLPE